MNEIKHNFQGQHLTIEKTREPGHAQWIAQKYALYTDEPVHIFICGGDGTIHETINGLVNAPNIYLSILPMGTGNDFVKSFTTLSQADFLDLSNYRNPIQKDIDVLKVDDEYVINTVSFGFDVSVADYANRIKNKFPLKGILPYYLGMLATLRKSFNNMYDIHMDDVKLPKQRYMFVVFCNGKYYGGGYQPCPDANLDDGKMDICLIQPIARHNIVRLAGAYEKGEHVHWSDIVSLHQAKIVRLDTDNKVILGNLDGEIREFRNPTIEVVKHGLRLLLPNIGD